MAGAFLYTQFYEEVDTIPYKPKTPCRYPGCKELTNDRYCDEHRSDMNKYYNKYKRDPDTYKRYGTAWRKIRKKYIAKHPLCEQCKVDGRFTPAEHVHHLLELDEGGTHDEKNLKALCRSCHSSLHLKKRNKNI